MGFGRDDNRGGGFNRGGDRGGFRGGRSSFGGGRGFGGGGNRGDRPMFKTTCSNCGKDCEVPFRPTTGKPVYCSECFEKMGNGGHTTPPRQDRPDFRPQSFVPNQSNAQLDGLNAKLDKIISLLEPKNIEAIVPDLVVEEVKEVKAPKVKKASKS